MQDDQKFFTVQSSRQPPSRGHVANLFSDAQSSNLGQRDKPTRTTTNTTSLASRTPTTAPPRPAAPAKKVSRGREINHEMRTTIYNPYIDEEDESDEDIPEIEQNHVIASQSAPDTRGFHTKTLNSVGMEDSLTVVNHHGHNEANNNSNSSQAAANSRNHLNFRGAIGGTHRTAPGSTSAILNTSGDSKHSSPRPSANTTVRQPALIRSAHASPTITSRSLTNMPDLPELAGELDVNPRNNLTVSSTSPRTGNTPATTLSNKPLTSAIVVERGSASHVQTSGQSTHGVSNLGRSQSSSVSLQRNHAITSDQMGHQVLTNSGPPTIMTRARPVMMGTRGQPQMPTNTPSGE